MDEQSEGTKQSDETKVLRIIALLIAGVIIVVLLCAPIWNGSSVL